ncbi:hypothetical protein CMI47_19355 [Candidatus Pacearchaeota archaeon]|nr:hypothetical protein [Candidatus Pacearchaeota archaeon]
MKIGNLVKLHESTRKCGQYAGKQAMIIDRDKYSQYVLLVEGEIIKFHSTQIEEEYRNESR